MANSSHLEKCNFRVVYFPSTCKNVPNKISVSGKYILNTFLNFANCSLDSAANFIKSAMFDTLHHFLIIFSFSAEDNSHSFHLCIFFIFCACTELPFIEIPLLVTPSILINGPIECFRRGTIG